MNEFMIKTIIGVILLLIAWLLIPKANTGDRKYLVIFLVCGIVGCKLVLDSIFITKDAICEIYNIN